MIKKSTDKKVGGGGGVQRLSLDVVYYSTA